MIKVMFFILGAVISSVLCFTIVYLSGTFFEHLGIQLYESEFDQRRNFNITFIFIAISSFSGGYIFAKKFR